MSRGGGALVFAAAAWIGCAASLDPEPAVGEALFVDATGAQRRLPVAVATWRVDVARIIAGTGFDDVWPYTHWPSWQTDSCATCLDGTHQLVPGSGWGPA